FNETMAAGRIPHREVLDGAMVIFGGAFLITPGFITDVFGLLLLLPPTRAVMRRLLVRALTGRIAIGVTGAAARRRPGFDVEGTATPVDDDYQPRTPRLPR
ncbi:MAG: FxsA family protein, partial [Thermoleophilaceae bacterium]